jgi:4-hydroxybenzoate polyprenyltransferase
LALFGAGSVLLRGAGCTINDLWDKDYDRQVERTKTRPLASGALSTKQALGFLALQLSLGLLILLQLNDYSKLIGASSLLLVATYPLFKRFTYWPQAFLGLTINWGALLGYAAVTGALENTSVVLPLYIGCIFWTLLYDTIYAHQDRQDDVKAGVKSTALLFGSNTKVYLSGFAFISACSWLAAGVAADLTLPYALGVLGATSHLAWQIKDVNLDSREDCMVKFVSNKWVGAILLAGIVMGH